MTLKAGVWSISDRKAPAGAERDAMEARGRELTARLAPGAVADIQRSVLRMFLGFPSAANLDMTGTVAAYASALAIYPAWAVSEVCADALRGKLSDKPDFVPSAATLAAAVSRKLAAPRSEAAKIARILAAQVYREVTDDERERVAAGWRALADELGMTEWRPDPAPRPETPEESLARFASAPPVGLSADALARVRG